MTDLIKKINFKNPAENKGVGVDVGFAISVGTLGKKRRLFCAVRKWLYLFEDLTLIDSKKIKIEDSIYGELIFLYSVKDYSFANASWDQNEFNEDSVMLTSQEKKKEEMIPVNSFYGCGRGDDYYEYCYEDYYDDYYESYHKVYYDDHYDPYDNDDYDGYYTDEDDFDIYYVDKGDDEDAFDDYFDFDDLFGDDDENDDDDDDDDDDGDDDINSTGNVIDIDDEEEMEFEEALQKFKEELPQELFVLRAYEKGIDIMFDHNRLLELKEPYENEELSMSEKMVSSDSDEVVQTIRTDKSIDELFKNKETGTYSWSLEIAEGVELFRSMDAVRAREIEELMEQCDLVWLKWKTTGILEDIIIGSIPQYDRRFDEVRHLYTPRFTGPIKCYGIKKSRRK